MGQSRSSRRRQELREQLWKDGASEMWKGVNEKGWFAAPRYLSVVLAILDDKELRGDQDLGRVYLDLWTRSYEEGVVEVTTEADHALLCGFPNRVRSWRDRVRKLEALGLVKVFAAGASDFAFIGMVHPHVALQRLRRDGKLKNDRESSREGPRRFRRVEADASGGRERAVPRREEGEEEGATKGA